MKTFGKILLGLLLAFTALTSVQAEHLVVLAVNDTHSQIDPASDGKGGLLRRRAIYDKVRAENENVLLVHAGDAVQGTLYFSLYGGEVEFAAMDSLKYDMIILGNHEFDNGIDQLAKYYRNVDAEKLSANYEFSNTPLAGMFKPYSIRRYGDKKVGFFGINVSPAGLIGDDKWAGMTYLRSLDVADATARYLKEVQKVDLAVMISHIGYDSYELSEPNDTMVVRSSRYIDLVIGGHSHTVVKPNSEFANQLNADGKTVIVGQNGKYGKYVSKYDIDLETGKIEYSQISVDSSWDEAASKYPAFEEWLSKYRAGVDSLMNNPVSVSARFMKNDSHAAQNWVTDATMDIIKQVSGINNVQFAIMNKGGIRTDMPQGVVTEGLINSMFPFDNRFVVLEITGQDLLDALKVMAGRKGDAISKELKVVYDDKGEITSAKLNGKAIKPNKTYIMATIDYLANGGDYMDPFKKAKNLFTDNVKYGEHILQYVKDLKAAGKVINATDEERMMKK